MAGFEMDFPEDFLQGLTMSGDDICEEALREAAPILEQSMKSSISEVTGEFSTGEALKSIKASKPKKAKNGAWIVNVGPKGYSKHVFRGGKLKNRTYNVSNALKLIWLNYGITGQQSPKPFLQKAVNKANDAVMKKMQEVYDRKVGANGPK